MFCSCSSNGSGTGVCVRKPETQMGVWGGAGQVKSARTYKLRILPFFLLCCAGSVTCVRVVCVRASFSVSFPASIVSSTFFFFFFAK